MALRKFSNVKAIELTSSGEDGVFVDKYFTGDEYHDGAFRPHVTATIHYHDGTSKTETSVSNDVYSSQENARYIADQELYRLAQTAKQKGIPVIMHTTGRSRERRESVKRNSMPVGVYAAEKTFDKFLIFLLIAAVCLVVLLK